MIKNVLFNWSHIIFSAVAVFLLYPFFIEVVGEDQYGIWLLIASVTGYFSLIQMGVPLANVRYVSKYYAVGDFKNLNKVLSINLLLFSCMAAITLISGIGVALFIDNIFHIPNQYIKYAKIAMILASLEVAIRFIFETVEGVLQARQEFVFINTVRNLILIIRVVLSFTLVTKDYGLIWISTLLLISIIIQSVIFFFYVKIKYPKLNFTFKITPNEIFLDIIGYSTLVLLLQLSSRISFQTDALVLSTVVSVESVVWFGVANSMLLYLSKLIIGISKVSMPKISELHTLGKFVEIKQQYIRIVRITGLIVFPTCLSLHLYGSEFIKLWMGENYRSVSSDVLSILVLGYAFFLTQRGAGFPILMGASKMKWPTIIMFTGALVNLFLSIMWGKKYGILGVAWGTTVPTLIVSFLIMLYLSSYLKIKLSKIFYESIIVPSFSLLLIFASYLLAEKIFIDSSFFIFFIKAFFTAFCGLIGIFFLLIKEDREHILAYTNIRKRKI